MFSPQPSGFVDKKGNKFIVKGELIENLRLKPAKLKGKARPKSAVVAKGAHLPTHSQRMRQAFNNDFVNEPLAQSQPNGVA